MIRLVAMALWLAAQPLRAEVYPVLHDVTGVAAGDVLNIRAAPDAGAEVIGTLAPDATGVEILSVAGGWGLVNAGEASGYVAMRFLERADAPDWNLLETPLTCLGTEPFWSLQIDPEGRKATFSSPGDTNGPALDNVHLWPATPWAPAAAVGLPVGTAVLQPLHCSDGMSERSFGISVDLFLGAPDTMRLSGCCRLGQS